jgi:hypothetical protein
MGFDDEVDAARKKLESALRVEDEPSFDDRAALAALLPNLKAKISSRRLAFAMVEEGDESSIQIVHLETDEILGFIGADEGEYVFESELEEYFDDFVDDDADSFVLRLYETLRADLAKYEVESAGDDT